jgi:hypothetical protein
MAVWVAVLFLCGFFVVSILVTRVRAELGPPTHDFPFTPSSFISGMIGTKRLDASSMTRLTPFRLFSGAKTVI